METSSLLKTQFTVLENVKIAYTETGQGDELILLHPNSGSKGVFEGIQLNALKCFHTYALDARCHGETVTERVMVDYPIMGEDVASFTKKMEIKKPKVIGYSDGAVVGLYLAKKYPSLFSDIICISPNLSGNAVRNPVTILIKLIVLIYGVQMKLGINKEKEYVRAMMMFADKYFDFNGLEDVTEKTHIYYGDKDICTQEHYKEIEALSPGADFHKLENTTHLSIMRNEIMWKDIFTILGDGVYDDSIINWKVL